MSSHRWSFLNYLTAEEKAALDYHDQTLDWLKGRGTYHEHERYKIVYEGKKRERLAKVEGKSLVA